MKVTSDNDQGNAAAAKWLRHHDRRGTPLALTVLLCGGELAAYMKKKAFPKIDRMGRNGMPATRVHDIVKRRRGYGLIHRPDGVWQWKVGSSYVTIYSPSGKRMTASCQDIAGVGDWERAKWKGYDQITPSIVSAWIDSCV